MKLKLTKEEADFLSMVFKNYVLNGNLNKNEYKRELRLHLQVGKKINEATSKSYGFIRRF